mmetsp:Transcript_24965/g.46032  ORF Transcript_24965/g.46032 Transcript_24965/m.46032 type:complete len:87 (+) Transcript_24965:66-326(+)
MVPHSDPVIVAPPSPPTPKIHLAAANTITFDPLSPRHVVVPISLTYYLSSRVHRPYESVRSPSPPKMQHVFYQYRRASEKSNSPEK